MDEWNCNCLGCELLVIQPRKRSADDITRIGILAIQLSRTGRMVAGGTLLGKASYLKSNEFQINKFMLRITPAGERPVYKD